MRNAVKNIQFYDIILEGVIFMIYKSLYDRDDIKVQSDEMIKEYVRRVNNLFSKFYYGKHNAKPYEASSHIDDFFVRTALNDKGASSLSDYIIQVKSDFEPVFNQPIRSGNYDLDDVLLHIELLLTVYKKFLFQQGRNNTVNESAYRPLLDNIVNATRRFLLNYNLDLIVDKGVYRIIVSKVPFLPNMLDNPELREDFLNYYTFMNTNNLHEKSKIISHIIKELEPHRKKLESLISKKYVGFLFNAVNKLNIRHSSESINDFSVKDLSSWYDFVYQGLLNLYYSIDKLVEVNFD